MRILYATGTEVIYEITENWVYLFLGYEFETRFYVKPVSPFYSGYW